MMRVNGSFGEAQETGTGAVTFKCMGVDGA